MKRFGVPIRLIFRNMGDVAMVNTRGLHLLTSYYGSNYVKNYKSILKFRTTSKVISEIKKFQKSIQKSTISIDAKKAVIKGLKEDFKFDVIMSKGGWGGPDDKFTIAEMAAAFTHEIGHVFEIIDSLGKINVSSSTIFSVLESSMTKGRIDRVKFIQGLAKNFPDKVSSSELNKILEEQVMAQFFDISSILQRIFADDANRSTLYAEDEKTGFETMADLFASRMGFRMEIASLRNKFSKSGMKIFFLTLESIVFIYNIINLPLIYVGITIALAGLFPFAAPIAPLVSVLATYYIFRMRIYNVIKGYEFFQYKSEKDLISLMRLEVINVVKKLLEEKAIDPDVAKDLIDEYEEIEKLFKDAFSVNHMLSFYVYQALPMSYFHKEMASTKQHNFLASLANNELFLKALELKLEEIKE